MAGSRKLFSCFGGGGGHRTVAARDPSPSSEEDQLGPPPATVVVQLFSSQGCSTSPEAELLLSRLGRGELVMDGGEGLNVVVLAFHVEYWDYLGWKDPFGSSIWTVRQKAYVEALRLDTLYTPQVVVQGRTQCLGTDEDGIISAVRSAACFPTPTLQATFQRPSKDTLQVSLKGALGTKVDGTGADVMVALYENGLLTDCRKGENRGKVLSNDFVVRKLEKLCAVKDISAKKNISGTVNFSLWEGFNSTKCGLVVFVQNKSLHIFGSQHFHLPESI
ncbi:hypothetical protein QJS10_CPB11g01014 [Acorus calamus]|uniref:Membrane lipoprotein lipid attachment site-like protein n=1 Tax=Acorus calamus TaxID=4465 RepID=A0AAV9DS99_ACOCL|nr:hypothetical protein QJS10_CPB11g01014 [Acorus calamus]